MNYHELLKKVEDHVNLFYLEHANESMYYHNLAHTKEVLDKAKKIADHYQLDDRQFFIVCAAACFHDTAYCIRGIEFHEQKSAELANVFLRSAGVDEADIAAIEKCIMATQLPQSPYTINEKIVCDADLYNLGTDDFRQNNRLLRSEAEALGKVKIDGIAWRASTISLLETHHYHTDYCQLLLTKTKAENLIRLKDRQEKKIKKLQATTEVQTNGDTTTVNIDTGVETTRPPLPRKKDRPIKGIETMFRISSANSLRMSVMADNKAHIMISVNSIIISVVLGLIVKNLDEHRNLMIPTIILLAVNVATIIYSVLATRPRVTGGTFTQQQVDNKSVNLLFFGSYYNMGFKEYDDGMKRMMADSEFLYGSLTKDIFWQGKVLGRKYSLLRTSYTIFLYGIIAAVIAFSAAVAFFD